MAKGCILVTGGAGYIGSHVALDLLGQGWDVVVADNLTTGVRALVPQQAEFLHTDVGDIGFMAEALTRYRISAVMHFAGSTVVPESVVDPLKYYRNNTAVSRNLMEACVGAGVNNFIFSSTAAVYGNPKYLPVDEAVAPNPITPYGTSKLMTEHMLRDLAAATPLRHVALRYFNVAGADPQGRSGQSTPNATHLIKVACETSCGKRPSMTLFGDDYDTADGTCVRDFIHVSDLAAAHVSALSYLLKGGVSQTINCGYGWGISVQQVIDAVERLSGKPITVIRGPRREGDIIEMVAETKRIREVLDWTPRYNNIDAIIGSALAWEQRTA